MKSFLVLILAIFVSCKGKDAGADHTTHYDLKKSSTNNLAKKDSDDAGQKKSAVDSKTISASQNNFKDEPRIVKAELFTDIENSNECTIYFSTINVTLVDADKVKILPLNYKENPTVSRAQRQETINNLALRVVESKLDVDGKKWSIRAICDGTRQFKVNFDKEAFGNSIPIEVVVLDSGEV